MQLGVVIGSVIVVTVPDFQLDDMRSYPHPVTSKEFSLQFRIKRSRERKHRPGLANRKSIIAAIEAR